MVLKVELVNQALRVQKVTKVFQVKTLPFLSLWVKLVLWVTLVTKVQLVSLVKKVQKVHSVLSDDEVFVVDKALQVSKAHKETLAPPVIPVKLVDVDLEVSRVLLAQLVKLVHQAKTVLQV